MKTISKKHLIGFSFIICSLSFSATLTSCGDANEYEDSFADNPSWVEGSLKISHPETVANSKWVRTAGLKKNAYGQEVQGFVESLDFVSADSVAVKMSQGATQGVWVDESNTVNTPYYEYTYSSITGRVEILKMTKDDKGKVSKTTIFVGVSVSGKRDVLTVVHYGDTPVQSYLLKQ